MFENEGKRELSALASAALGCLIAVVLSIVLMLIVSAVLLLTKDPASLSWCGAAILLICCFVCGFIGSKITEQKPFLAGAGGGVMFFAIVFIIALVCRVRINPLYIALSLLCVFAGAFLGSIRKDKNSSIPAFDDKKYNELFK